MSEALKSFAQTVDAQMGEFLGAAFQQWHRDGGLLTPVFNRRPVFGLEYLILLYNLLEEFKIKQHCAANQLHRGEIALLYGMETDGYEDRCFKYTEVLKNVPNIRHKQVAQILAAMRALALENKCVQPFSSMQFDLLE